MGALAARQALDDAMATGDAATPGNACFADDVIIHVPRHRVLDGDKILAAYAAGGQAIYQTGLTVIWEFCWGAPGRRW